MKKEEMQKKINIFYRCKTMIIYGLLLSLLVMLSGVIACLVKTDSNYWGNIGIIGYISLILFVIMASFFPVGKYNIKKYLKKNDITELLKYINEFNGDYNKYMDNLVVIKNTVREMIHDADMMRRGNINIDEEERTINSAWDQLYDYLYASDLMYINRENIKKYAEELIKEIKAGKIIFDELEKISVQRTKEPYEKRVLPISRSKVLLILTTGALLILVIFKFILVINPEQFNIEEWPINIIYQTGSDLIAFIFALYTIWDKFKKIE
jgi:hypothetical protein